MKNRGYSLIEIMVVLGMLGGIALVVTKLASNSLNTKNESAIANDYNDLVREGHFLLSHLKSCKVSLAGSRFKASEEKIVLKGLELWTADSAGEKRDKKKFAKGVKVGGLEIQDITLEIDPMIPGPAEVSDALKNSTGTVKILIVKPKTKNSVVDLEHSINVNYTVDKSLNVGTVVDCGEKLNSRDNTVWCGVIQNPCGIEVIPVVAVGIFKNGKFTGVFQPTGFVEGKICTGAEDHPATLKKCSND